MPRTRKWLANEGTFSDITTTVQGTALFLTAEPAGTTLLRIVGMLHLNYYGDSTSPRTRIIRIGIHIGSGIGTPTVANVNADEQNYVWWANPSVSRVIRSVDSAAAFREGVLNLPVATQGARLLGSAGQIVISTISEAAGSASSEFQLNWWLRCLLLTPP